MELINSGESDGESDSKKNTSPPGSPGADPDRTRLTGSGERGASMSEIFGPSDSGDESSSHSEKSGDGGDAPMRPLREVPRHPSKRVPRYRLTYADIQHLCLFNAQGEQQNLTHHSLARPRIQIQTLISWTVDMSGIVEWNVHVRM